MKRLLIILMVILGLTLFCSPVFGKFPLEYKTGEGTVRYFALPATVAIVSNAGFGAGALATEDGYTITAKHVVGSDKYVDVYTEDFMRYRGRVVGYHSIAECDIAVIKIDPFADKPFKTFSTPDYEGEPGSWNFVANVHQSMPGDEIYVIGHPIGLTWSITKGIISARRLWEDDGLKFYQIDAPTNKGNSGGPLVNANGQILGIVSFGVPAWAAEGLHFAISIESFAEEILMLINQDRERLEIITNVWGEEKAEEEPKPRQIIITLPDETVTEEE